MVLSVYCRIFWILYCDTSHPVAAGTDSRAPLKPVKGYRVR